MKNKLLAVFAFVALSLSLPVLQPVNVSAAPPDMCTDLTNAFFGIKPWYACLPGADEGEPQITALTDVFLIIFPVVEGLVKLAFLVAAGYMFWSLFNLMRSQGDPGKRATAIGGIRDASVGLIIVLIAIPIVNFTAEIFV